jgi:hypothetical protein
MMKNYLHIRLNKKAALKGFEPSTYGSPQPFEFRRQSRYPGCATGPSLHFEEDILFIKVVGLRR